jgi:hypothetical protein
MLIGLMKKVAVIQPNYIPWKGYFDIIHDVDTFVFYDDVQYTKNDWRNRNIIRGSTGSFWLTIPISKSAVNLPIHQVQISDSRWQKKHFLAIKACYSKSQYFDDQFDLIKKIYEETTWSHLSDLNEYIITTISELLGIKVKFIRSSELNLEGTKMDRLLHLLKQIGADEYVSGPSAKEYIDEKRFESEGIKLVYKQYLYPEYHQLWDGAFNHKVSILDLLFNMGPKAPYYIWGWRDE